MNGAEFVTRLREFAPEIPVLVISGLAEAEDEYAALGVDFRMKPLLPQNLIATVQTLIESSTAEPRTSARI
jgi:DNA-binding response OmpR family regulator